MPRASAIKLEVVRDLATGLRFAPGEALRRAVDRVEELATELDPATSYPPDWVVFRVTGYRPERRRAMRSTTGGTEDPIPGPALLADLSALAERLSEASKLTVEQATAAGAVRLPELCARWRVSAKTVERWRRRGLIARRAAAGRARAALVFMPAVVAAFERTHADELARAGGFSRIDPDTEERMVRRAARYRRLFSWPLGKIAARLGERFGRTPEAVRALLLRQGKALDLPRRTRAGKSSGAAAARALARGLEPAEIGKRWGVSGQSVVHAALLARRTRLREALEGGDLSASASPTFEHPDAVEVILGPAPVRSGLGGAGSTDLLAFLRDARARATPAAGEEATRALAYQFLRYRAGRLISGLDAHHPGATEVDSAETMLRWAARLKAELVRTQLHLVVDTLEGLLKGPPEGLAGGLTSAQMADLVRAAVGALGEAVDQFEPQRPALMPAGRLAAPAGMAAARACTRWLKEHAARGAARPGRASSRLLEGMPMPDWTLSCAPWQAWLEPDPRVRAAVKSGAMEEGARVLLGARFGWLGAPPRTLAELAKERGTTVARVAMMERKAVRAVLDGGKAGGA